MGNTIIWALLTGGLTGGIGASIVLLRNHAILRREHDELGTALAARRAELAQLEARLSRLESGAPQTPDGAPASAHLTPTQDG